MPGEVTVDLMDNANRSIDPEMCKVYLNLSTLNTDSMVDLIGFKFVGDEMESAEGGARSGKTSYQCLFCPVVTKTMKQMNDHLSGSHDNFLLSFISQKRVHKRWLIDICLYCRHCDYVTKETFLMWIHFGMYHGIDSILSLSDQPEHQDDGRQDEVLPQGSKQVVKLLYLCTKCPTTDTNVQHIVQHITDSHPPLYSHHFVEVIQSRRQFNLVPPTGDDVTRTNCFVCVECMFVSYNTYSALSHHFTCHQHLKPVYVCMTGTCQSQWLSVQTFTNHVKNLHPTASVPMSCSVSLLQADLSSECTALINRSA